MWFCNSNISQIEINTPVLVISNKYLSDIGRWYCSSKKAQCENERNCETGKMAAYMLEDWKQILNMKVTVVLIIFSTIWTVLKSYAKSLQELEIQGIFEDTQMTALVKSAKILRRGLQYWENFLSFDFWWKPTRYCQCENNDHKIIYFCIFFVAKNNSFIALF